MNRRVELAEQIAALLSWCPARSETPREKALHELWREWASLPDVSTSPDDWPELSDDAIDRLAVAYDERMALLRGGMVLR